MHQDVMAQLLAGTCNAGDIPAVIATRVARVDPFRIFPIRLVGYGCAVSEALRNRAPFPLVEISYGTSVAFMCGHVVYQAVQASRNGESQIRAMWNAFVFESLASFFIPVLVSFGVRRATKSIMSKMKGVPKSQVKWGPPVAALGALAILVWPLDALLDYLIGNGTQSTQTSLKQVPALQGPLLAQNVSQSYSKNTTDCPCQRNICPCQKEPIPVACRNEHDPCSPCDVSSFISLQAAATPRRTAMTFRIPCKDLTNVCGTCRKQDHDPCACHKDPTPKPYPCPRQKDPTPKPCPCPRQNDPTPKPCPCPRQKDPTPKTCPVCQKESAPRPCYENPAPKPCQENHALVQNKSRAISMSEYSDVNKKLKVYPLDYDTVEQRKDPSHVAHGARSFLKRDGHPSEDERRNNRSPKADSRRMRLAQISPPAPARLEIPGNTFEHSDKPRNSSIIINVYPGKCKDANKEISPCQPSIQYNDSCGNVLRDKTLQRRNPSPCEYDNHSPCEELCPCGCGNPYPCEAIECPCEYDSSSRYRPPTDSAYMACGDQYCCQPPCADICEDIDCSDDYCADECVDECRSECSPHFAKVKPYDSPNRKCRGDVNRRSLGCNTAYCCPCSDHDGGCNCQQQQTPCSCVCERCQPLDCGCQAPDFDPDFDPDIDDDYDDDDDDPKPIPDYTQRCSIL